MHTLPGSLPMLRSSQSLHFLCVRDVCMVCRGDLRECCSMCFAYSWQLGDDSTTNFRFNCMRVWSNRYVKCDWLYWFIKSYFSYGQEQCFVLKLMDNQVITWILSCVVVCSFVPDHAICCCFLRICGFSVLTFLYTYFRLSIIALFSYMCILK